MRTVKARLQDYVSVKDFGAIGDGVTDDTSAINAALASSATHIHFPNGVYRVAFSGSSDSGMPILRSALIGRKITCDGTITANSKVLRCLGIYGEQSQVQININGAEQIYNGVTVYAGQCRIENCSIEDLKAVDFSCAAIDVRNVNSGSIIRNNVIRRCTSLSDSTSDDQGTARGISISMTSEATHSTIIENNYIERIMGKYGDSIAVLSKNETSYLRSDAIVRNNTIDTFSRRAVKVQGSNNCILDNYICSRLTESDVAELKEAVISLIQGGDQIIRGNILDHCQYFTQISVVSGATDSYSNFYVENNKILGLEDETINNAIFISPRGKNVVVKDNEIRCGIGLAISIGGATEVLVSDNRIYCSDFSSRPAVNLTASALKAIVKDNILMSGSRLCVFEIHAPGVILIGNINRTNSPLFRDEVGQHNSLIAQNIMDGSGLLYSSNQSLNGNQISQNYAIGQQTNSAPANLVVGSAGPGVSLTGIWISAGTKAWTRSPVAGGKAGWIALATGLAESITWKPFGQIDT